MLYIKVLRPRYSDKGTPTMVFPQRCSHQGIPTRGFNTLTDIFLRIHLIGCGVPKHNLGTVKLWTATEPDNGSDKHIPTNTNTFRQRYSDKCIPTKVLRQMYSDKCTLTKVFRHRCQCRRHLNNTYVHIRK